MLFKCTKASAIDKEPQAMADNLLASSMANISFGSAGLGMVHMLAQPFEEIFHVPHGQAVGIMLPRVLEQSDLLPDETLGDLAAALGVRASGNLRQGIVEGIDAFYGELGVSGRFEPAEATGERNQEVLERAHGFSTFLVPRDDADKDLVIAENGHRLPQDAAARVYANVTV
jgi:alcohol dehydrogenase class IV